MKNIILTSFILAFTFGCSTASKTAVTSKFKTNSETVAAGSSVNIKGQPQKLYNEGGHLTVGKPIAHFVKNMKNTDFKGKVTVVSFVPSVQTPVCEVQTHILGETKELDSRVQKISISRENETILHTFAKDAKLTNIRYLSDSKDKKFGELSGLLMKEKNLISRGVMVVDQKGIIRHLQIVPEITELPDMEKAFKVANQLINSAPL